MYYKIYVANLTIRKKKKRRRFTNQLLIEKVGFSKEN